VNLRGFQFYYYIQNQNCSSKDYIWDVQTMKMGFVMESNALDCSKLLFRVRT